MRLRLFRRRPRCQARRCRARAVERFVWTWCASVYIDRCQAHAMPLWRRGFVSHRIQDESVAVAWALRTLAVHRIERVL